MPNVKYLAHQTPNTKKLLTSDVLYVPNFYHLCPYHYKFATIRTQMLNRKNNILFDFSLSSQFFIWFFLSLLRICLSPKFPTRVLPLLKIGHEQEAHLWRRIRRRRWPRKEERQPWLRLNRWRRRICRTKRRSWGMGLRCFWFLISLFSLICWVVGSQLYDDGD